MTMQRHVKLPRNSGEDTISLPAKFALSSDDVIIRKERDRLIIEPAPAKSLLALLATLAAIEEDFPPIPDSAPDHIEI